MFPYIFQNITHIPSLEYIISYLQIDDSIFGTLDKRDYWSGRTLHYKNVSDHILRKTMIETLSRTISKINSLDKRPVYCEHLSVAKWPSGYSLEPHADAENPSGCPAHPYPWRNFAAITFLNDNFSGGILYFPNKDLRIKPNPGHTIIFPGTLEYLHGVTEILDGNRYTIASFLTYDATKSYIIY